MNKEKALELGLRFLTFKYTFESDGNSIVWDILKDGDFEEAKGESLALKEEMIWCKPMESKITFELIQDLIVEHFDEHDDMYFEEGKAAELIGNTELECKLLAEKLSINFDKQKWFEPTEFIVDFN